MKAKDAIEGKVYNLPARGSQTACKAAVFNSWNHNHQWLLFVVYDAQGKRSMRQIMPEEDIQPVN